METPSHIELVKGVPVIKGRGLKVHMVAGMYVKAGAGVEEVMQHYGLSAAEAHAALAYYYDNREAFEAAEQALQPLTEQAEAASAAGLARMRAARETGPRS